MDSTEQRLLTVGAAETASEMNTNDIHLLYCVHHMSEYVYLCVSVDRIMRTSIRNINFIVWPIRFEWPP